MAVTKVTKTVMLSIDQMQKIDVIRKAGDMKFSAALETILDMGFKEYEKKMGPVSA